MYRTIREQDDHLVQLALEHDQTVLELDQVKLELAAVRVENENLHIQLAKYGQVIKVYDNQHTPPSRNTITRKEINTQKKEERKEKNPTGRRGQHVGHKGVSASRKADQTIRRTQDKCGSCGGTNLKTVKIISTIKTDVPPTKSHHNMPYNQDV